MRPVARSPCSRTHWAHSHRGRLRGAPTNAGKLLQKGKRGQALPIDMSNFLTSFLMSGRPTAAEQYRQTRLGSPM